MTTVDLSGRGLGRLVPGSVGVAYVDRRPIIAQWAWSRSDVDQSRSRQPYSGFYSTATYCPAFDKVWLSSVADLHQQSLAIKWNAEFTEGG